MLRAGLIILVFGLGASALAWLSASVLATRDTLQATAVEALRVTELRGSVVHLDEVLTMSARMAAATGDPRWIARYRSAADRLQATLDASLAEVPEPLRERLAATAEAARAPLLDEERQAIALVEAGRGEEAAAILDGSAHDALKRRFADSLQGFNAQLDALARARAAAMHMRASLEVMALGLCAALLVAMGIALAGRVRLRATLRRSQHAARTDPVTGLANRRGFAERLAAALGQNRLGGARDRACPVAVLVVDLDRFKAVNDAHGHEAGDRLLAEVGRRIRASVRAAEGLARLGGDEFGLVATMTTLPSDAVAEAQAEALRIGGRILESVSRPIEVAPGVTARVGASIGIALAPSDGTDPATLLRAADAALYGAKAEGRGRLRLFDPALAAKAQARAALEADLRAAVEAGAIEPYFQPMVELSGRRRVVGMEVLARWHHPTRGEIAPAEFIPVAEDAGLMGALTLDLLRRACGVAARLPAHVSIALNVSPLQLREPGLCALVRETLEQTGLDPRRLELELTEVALLGDLQAAREVLSTLSGFGVRISLDDFGTGFSSLRHLKTLPIDRLKVDATFVQTMTADVESRKIVAAVLGLAQSLGLVTVAEGVADEATRRQLEEMGCDIGQGWLFGRPMPEADVAGLSADLRRAAAAAGK